MSKYKNRKVEVDGIQFDSKKEARRFQVLVMLEKDGAIHNLKRQVKFVLVPAQYSETELTKAGKPKCIERECAYIADFVYQDCKGNVHVEDVKGYRKDGAYNIFTIKRKLMLHVHGIRIEEI